MGKKGKDVHSCSPQIYWWISSPRSSCCRLFLLQAWWTWTCVTSGTWRWSSWASGRAVRPLRSSWSRLPSTVDPSWPHRLARNPHWRRSRRNWTLLRRGERSVLNFPFYSSLHFQSTTCQREIIYFLLHYINLTAVLWRSWFYKQINNKQTNKNNSNISILWWFGYKKYLIS